MATPLQELNQMGVDVMKSADGRLLFRSREGKGGYTTPAQLQQLGVDASMVPLFSAGEEAGWTGGVSGGDLLGTVSSLRVTAKNKAEQDKQVADAAAINAAIASWNKSAVEQLSPGMTLGANGQFITQANANPTPE